MTRYLQASTSAPGRPPIPASRNSRASCAGIEHGPGFAEGREARGASLFFHFDSRRPDIPRQDSLARGSGRLMAPTQRMNVRPWFGSAVPACALHSFPGGGDKQPVELLADEDQTTPAASCYMMSASGAKRSFAEQLYQLSANGNGIRSVRCPVLREAIWHAPRNGFVCLAPAMAAASCIVTPMRHTSETELAMVQSKESVVGRPGMEPTPAAPCVLGLDRF
jgi:hypothetical protein